MTPSGELTRPVAVDDSSVASTAARAYLGYLALGLLAVALNSALGGSNAVYDALGLSAVAAMVAGVALHRPRAWRAWLGLAASQLVFALGDIAFDVGAGSPSFADVLYLGGDALLIVSMAWLVVSAGGGRALSGHLDASLIALIVGVCGWALFASDAMTSGSPMARAIGIAYPVADLVLFGLLVRVLFVRGERTPSYWLLLGAVVSLSLADAGYVVPQLSSGYQPGGWLDAGWLSSYALFGVAALHPSMARLILPRQSTGPSLPVRRAFLLGLGLIAVPSALIVQRLLGRPVNALGNEIAMVLIAGAVVLRGGFLIRELERLRFTAEASERRFRMVFERAPIGISFGRNGVMSETNPALQRMLGYTGHEFARMHYTQVTHPDDMDLKQQIALDKGTSDAFSIDKRYRHKDGTTIDAHVHVALDLEDGLGISLIEDVTDRLELENQLRQAQKMDSIGKLAGGIAHDFNNLMTAVIGYSDLLRPRIDGDDDALAKVEAIRGSAVRAGDLTRQLLAFSRRQVLQTQEIDLREVVERMDMLLRRLIGGDVRLQTLFGSEPIVVRADRTQLEQVVMNLAVNARDAMPEGGTLTLALVSAAGSAVLSVSDEGIGMDDATLERIFEPFFTTKPLAESSGLGLSTVHGIVGQSGGTIEVESEPGRGTSFTIRLPAVESPLLPEPEPVATLVD